MSRMHFKAFAEAIAGIENVRERKRTATLVGSVCAGFNSEFKWARWYRACGIKEKKGC